MYIWQKNRKCSSGCFYGPPYMYILNDIIDIHQQYKDELPNESYVYQVLAVMFIFKYLYLFVEQLTQYL